MKALLLLTVLAASNLALGYTSEPFKLFGEIWVLEGSEYYEKNIPDNAYGPSVHIKNVKIVNTDTEAEYWIEGHDPSTTQKVCSAWTNGAYPNGHNYGDYKKLLWGKSVMVFWSGETYKEKEPSSYRGRAAKNLNCYQSDYVYLD